MRIGILVNDIETEQTGYTTTRISTTALNCGHEVWYMGVGDLSYDPDEYIRAKARMVTAKKAKSSESYFKSLTNGKNVVQKRISVNDLDILLLRNDPSIESNTRAWARTIGIEFGRLAVRHGVIVLNDPNGLSNAMNKMYFQQFPEEVRARTLITKEREEIKKFAKEQGVIVLKPLLGSGGRNVFLVTPDNIKNLNQMIDAILRDGYIVAQEYLPRAEEGDIRLFLLNGVPFKHKDKYAAFRRVSSGEDIRTNLHSGGKIRRVDIDKKVLHLAEVVRPKLVQDGMFFVGLDIVGDKILEINVFSPGGLGTAKKLEGVNFTYPFVKALERKVQYMHYYRRKFSNSEMATL